MPDLSNFESTALRNQPPGRRQTQRSFSHRKVMTKALRNWISLTRKIVVLTKSLRLISRISLSKETRDILGEAAITCSFILQSNTDQSNLRSTRTHCR